MSTEREDKLAIESISSGGTSNIKGRTEKRQKNVRKETDEVSDRDGSSEELFEMGEKTKSDENDSEDTEALYDVAVGKETELQTMGRTKGGYDGHGWRGGEQSEDRKGNRRKAFYGMELCGCVGLGDGFG